MPLPDRATDANTFLFVIVTLSGMALSLRPLKPEILPGGTFRLPEEERVIKVGRAEGNELCVEHISVSSFHATLAVDGDASVEVIDHGSSNGTFVNGIRVDRRRLAEGDLLRFATAEFRVQAWDPHASNGGNGRQTATPEDGGEDSTIADEPETVPEIEPEPEPEPLLPLSEVEAEKARLLAGFEEEREVLLRDLDRSRSELDLALTQAKTLQGNLTQRESELNQRDELLRARDEEIRRLRRDLEDGAQREQRLQAGQSEARREVIEREGIIAGLNYEMQTREGQMRQLDEHRARLQQVCDDYALAHAELQNTLADTTGLLDQSNADRDAARHHAAGMLQRLAALGDRLLADWRAWIPGDLEGANPDDSGDDAIFARVATVADAIRSELDRIEPIWHLYGDGVQAELLRRCDLLRADLAALEEEISRRREELAGLEADLTQFRELMDLEVRRAQGLSRKGIEIEIPERFETMTIARDREQELLRGLVERIEILDQLLEGYRGSRKLREVHHEIADFRNRLAGLLDAGGVRPFEIEVGTFVTLRHRREVQILSRKGWGTKQYAEIPFQPGEVVKVIRPGYRIGEGDGAVILRKVEVLIRGVEE